MTTKEIADRLVALNRENNYQQCYSELYDMENIVSIENWGTREEYKGAEALKAKGEKWEAGVETMHETRVSEPLVADKSFAVTFYMDITFKPESGMPGRTQLTELAVYHVNDAGKIYKEEFSA